MCTLIVHVIIKWCLAKELIWPFKVTAVTRHTIILTTPQIADFLPFIITYVSFFALGMD